MLRQFVASIFMIGVAGTADSAPPLDWIGGHWCADLGRETVEEFWLPPHGGVAIGMSRTLRDGRTAGFEYLRIVDIDGIPSYVAQPGGRPPTTFKRTAGGERWIRFENPGHDFPQRIEYRRDGDGLHAETAGPGEDGTESVISFDYRRCDAQAFQSGLANEHRSSVLATTDRFELHSNPRVSLHHFLIAWAAADHDEWPPYAVPIAERGSWHAVLDDEEERAWSAATEAYAATRGRNVVFDQGLIAVRGWAAGVAPRESIPGDRPSGSLSSHLPVVDDCGPILPGVSFQVAKARKLIERMRANPKDWRMASLEVVASHYGVTVRKSGGSHFVFLHPDSNMAVSIPYRRAIKPIYVSQFIALIDDIGSGS